MMTMAENLTIVLGIGTIYGVLLALIFVRANARAQDEAAINTRLAEFVGKNWRLERGQGIGN